MKAGMKAGMNAGTEVEGSRTRFEGSIHDRCQSFDTTICSGSMRESAGVGRDGQSVVAA